MISSSPKLPLTGIRFAYAIVFRNFAGLLRVSVLPLIMIAAITVLPPLVLPAEWTGSGSDGRIRLTPALVDSAVSLLYLPFASMIAVAWHNFVLRGTPLSLRFDFLQDRELRGYLALGAAFELVSQVVIFAFALLIDQTVSHGRSSLWISALCTWILFAVSVFVTIRLSPLFPAVAVSGGVTLAQAWRATRGNFWRLFWGGVLATGPMAVAMGLLAVWTEPYRGKAGLPFGMTLDALSIVAYYLAGVVELGFLSLAYRHFFESPDPPA